MKFLIPQEVKAVINLLKKNNFEAYLVGGCVRDLFLKRKPKDWDIATNALPEDVLKIFPDGFYENRFFTVGVKTNSEDETLKIIEITTYRTEGKYLNKRHPQDIKRASNIFEDLKRRDFTINDLAMNMINEDKFELVDPLKGLEDLNNKIIKCVGDPYERFNEDALRMLRAIRLAVELNFEIERKTFFSIRELAFNINLISKERIRDEFIKIVMSQKAVDGILLLLSSNLLKFIIPELEEGIDVEQNKHHIYTVFEHNLKSLEYAVNNNYSLELRLASLFHDIGKPRTKEGEGKNSTFYNHEIVGASMTYNILKRLKFPKEVVKKVTHLVRHHLFYYNVGEVTEAGVRRFIKRVGLENVDDLIKVREADRIGSGVKKARPYKLRHLLYMIEKVKKDPVESKMLKIKGDDIMRILNISSGPKIGQILFILLDEVLDSSEKNNKEYLEKRVKELGNLSEVNLAELAKKAKEKKENFEKKMDEDMKKNYYI